MVDSHTKTFFGQNTGIIVSSFSRTDPFTFIHFFKRKPDGTWEKPSSKEGKSIKFSLEEIVMILRVLNRQTPSWDSQHNYKDTTTSISFNWEDEETEALWINIGKYSKRLNLAQIEIFRLLLSHILQEKVIHSTHPKKIEGKSKSKKNLSLETIETIEFKNPLSEVINVNVNESINSKIIDDGTSNINGSIVGETGKAFLIKFENNEEWIPKSTIKNHTIIQNANSQNFLIDNWILKKLNLIS
ncbi:MAG: hypothetical protein EAX91_12675 [Candidatus Lokiarchaeota archaeon]|nr:hypothetical protein [Candidatus Lokiarchaeota archaeon]